jgi:hypothetical protein
MAPRKPHALFHGVRTVKYNDGTPTPVDAVVVSEPDSHSAVLAAWTNGVLQLINNGNPVPERAPADYGPEGGGVTYY